MCSTFLDLASLVVILTAWIGGLIAVILALKMRPLDEESGLVRSALWQWGVALFLIVLVKVPTLLATCGGLQLTISNFTPYYAFAFVMRVLSYCLLYRGLIIFATREKFWTNTLPAAVFAFVSFFLLLLFFQFHISVPNVANMARVFHYLAILFLIWASLHLAGKSYLKMISKIGMGIFSIGWIGFLIFDVQIALGYGMVPLNLWFFVIASKNLAVEFSVVQLIILLGMILFAYPYYAKNKSV